MEIVLPQIEDMMSSPLVTIEEDRSVSEAVDLMLERGIRRLPVMSAGGEHLVGIITIAEARDAAGQAKEGSEPAVRLAMSAPVHTVRYLDLLDRAVTIMALHKVGAVPVLRYGQPVGILTESDVFRWLASKLDYEGQASWQ